LLSSEFAIGVELHSNGGEAPSFMGGEEPPPLLRKRKKGRRKK